MKHFIIQSDRNVKGIVCAGEEDVREMREHYFQGHKNVTVVEISEEQYSFVIYGA